MKKRDLTKLALMGVALAMVSGNANADECCDAGTCVEGEQIAAHGCGNAGCGGAPPPKPRNRQLSEKNSGMGGMHESCSNMNSCNNGNGMNGNGSCHNMNSCNGNNGNGMKNGSSCGNKSGCGNKRSGR